MAEGTSALAYPEFVWESNMQHFRDDPYHATIEVVNDQCKGLGIIKSLGIQQCKLLDVRSLPDGLTRHLISFPSSETYTIPQERRHEVMIRRKQGKETLLWFDTDGCGVCQTLLRTNSFLVSGRKFEGNTLVYSFVAPTLEAFQKALVQLEENGLNPKIIEAGTYRSKTKVLTEKQEKALWLGLKMGFFDYPRKVNTSELSQRLGIKPSTLSEILRRGMRRLLEYHYKGE